MRRPTIVATLLCTILLIPAHVWAAGGTLRFGAFFPRAQSNLFADDASLYTVDKSSWIGGTGGIEFDTRVTPQVELAFHLDGYGRSIDTSYRDYLGESDEEIRQTLRLTAVPLGITVRVMPNDFDRKLVPYVGVGASALVYKYEEFGRFIDFHDPNQRIQSASFAADGWTMAWHAVGGLRIGLNEDFSLVTEVRYQWARPEIGDDFSPQPGEAPFKLDLSGPSVTMGVHVRF